MGRKLPIRNFEEFTGEDITSSPLNSDKKGAQSFQNLIKLYNGSFTARPGLRLAAQPLHSTKVFKYSYLDSTGEPQEELLCVGFPLPYKRGYLHRLKENEVTVNYTGSDVWSYSIVLSGGNKRFRLVDDGVQVLDFNMGTGYEQDFVTLYDLKVAVDAVADFTLTVPETAVVDGDQTPTWSGGYPATVADYTVLWHTMSFNSTFIHIFDDDIPDTEIVGLTVAQVNSATSLKLKADRLAPYYVAVTKNTIPVSDEDVLGHGLYPAAILKDDLSYTFWEPVIELYNIQDGYISGTDVFIQGLPNTQYSSPFWPTSREVGCSRRTKVIAVNKNNCIYITGNNVAERQESERGSLAHNSGVYKYDGTRLKMSGVISNTEQAELTIAQSGTTAPLPAGVYYYKLSFLTNDNQGNTIERFFDTFRSITANGTNDVNLSIFDLRAGSFRKYGYISMATTGTVTSDDVIPVPVGHGWKVGDYIYVNTSLNSVRLKIVETTYNSITVDRILTSLASATIISNALIRVWRTKVNGSKADSSLFKAWEVPATCHSSGATALVDSRADIDLAETLTAVRPEFSQYSLPKGSTMTNFQGLLTIGGGESNKNVIYWEDPNAPEFTSLAFNNTEIPVKEENVVALQEDQNRALVAYSPFSQYTISGNLRNSEVEVSKTVDNGFGALTADSVVSVHEFLVGLGKLGVWRTNYSQILGDIGKGIQKLFRPFEQSEWACFVQYVKKDNSVHVFLGKNAATVSVKPTTEATAAINSYYHYVYNIDGKCWSRYVYNNVKQCANGGIETFNDKRYQQSFVYDANFTSDTGADGQEIARWTGYLHEEMEDSYVDHVYSYNYEYISEWDDMGSPEYDEAVTDFILYFVQPDFFVNDYIITFESYRNWDFTKIDTQRSITVTSTDIEKKFSFDKQYKARRRAFKLSGTVDNNPPVISGYSWIWADTQYKKGRVVP